MTPTLANDPAVQAAILLNDARRPRVRLKYKLLLVVPFPVGCYLLLKGLLMPGVTINDPIDSMIVGTIRGIESMGGFLCFYLSLKAYFEIRRAQKPGC